jgi:hypothetical protein
MIVILEDGLRYLYAMLAIPASGTDKTASANGFRR